MQDRDYRLLSYQIERMAEMCDARLKYWTKRLAEDENDLDADVWLQRQANVMVRLSGERRLLSEAIKAGELPDMDLEAALDAYVREMPLERLTAIVAERDPKPKKKRRSKNAK